MDNPSDDMRIRSADVGDLPVVLTMLDDAVAWANDRGYGEQWGTEPYSRQPGGAERIEGFLSDKAAFIAEADGAPVGFMVLDSGPSPRLPIAPADEPERYVRLLVSDRRNAGRGIGSALLAHAVEETRRAGVSLLRVDCWAGAGGALIAYYERNGFVPTVAFLSGTWPGQVLAQRVS